MVIEHAERFGLAQLHQLRGRVGRGADESVCILLYEHPLSEGARTRLKVIYEQADGFRIAHEDMLLRGPGEYLGARQSGLPLLRFADLVRDEELVAGRARGGGADARPAPGRGGAPRRALAGRAGRPDGGLTDRAPTEGPDAAFRFPRGVLQRPDPIGALSPFPPREASAFAGIAGNLPLAAPAATTRFRAGTP